MSDVSAGRWPRWLPRLIVESIVVVFSIVLALVVNEWRQEAEREDRRARAIEAIGAELLHNYREIERVHPYHTRLADTLLALSAAGVESADPGIRPHGWVRSVDLVSAAWETARVTGASSEFRYEILLTISRAYEEQATFRRQREDLVAGVLRMALEGDTPSLLNRPAGMAGAMNQLSDWEAGLLREYARALEPLGVTVDTTAWTD